MNQRLIKKLYQRLEEKMLRENTVDNTLALLAERFNLDEVNAVAPALRNILDI